MRLAVRGRGVVVVNETAQFHSTEPELRLCAGSNPVRGVLEICQSLNSIQQKNHVQAK